MRGDRLRGTRPRASSASYRPERSALSSAKLTPAERLAPSPFFAPGAVTASLHRSASKTRPDIRACHWAGLSLTYFSTMATSWLGGRGVLPMQSSKLTSIFSLAVRFSAGTRERTAAPKSTRLSTTPVTYAVLADAGRARQSLPVTAPADEGHRGASRPQKRTRARHGQRVKARSVMDPPLRW